MDAPEEQGLEQTTEENTQEETQEETKKEEPAEETQKSEVPTKEAPISDDGPQAEEKITEDSQS